jgi:hypothetical protein
VLKLLLLKVKLNFIAYPTKNRVIRGFFMGLIYFNGQVNESE